MAKQAVKHKVQTITKDMFIDKHQAEYFFWEDIKDIPKEVEEGVFGGELADDVITPFKKGGKDWLFEYIYKYQPRTGAILKNGVLFGLAEKKVRKYGENGENKIRTNFLGVEVDDKVLSIFRDSCGNNLSDAPENTTYRQELIEEEVRSLPKELMMAYYYRFRGLSLIGNYLLDYTLDLPQENWTTFDDVLSLHGIPRRVHKECYAWMEQYMPKFNLKSAKDPCFDFMGFLQTNYYNAKNKIKTTLLVKTHLQDGVVYALQNKDLENMKIVENPVEVIDRYFEYVLTTCRTDFDFEPYLRPLVKLEDQK